MPNGTIPSWIPTNPVVGATYTPPDGTLALNQMRLRCAVTDTSIGDVVAHWIVLGN